MISGQVAAAWLIEQWNFLPGVIRCSQLTAARKKKASQRLADEQWRSSYLAAMEKIQGGCELPARPTIDWFLAKDTVKNLIGGSTQWRS